MHRIREDESDGLDLPYFLPWKKKTGGRRGKTRPYRRFSGDQDVPAKAVSTFVGNTLKIPVPTEAHFVEAVFWAAGFITFFAAALAARRSQITFVAEALKPSGSWKPVERSVKYQSRVAR